MLHPIDGKPDGTPTGGFKGQSGPGLVRDFVLKMSGVRIGYESYKTPEVSYEDDGTMMNSFYGGTVNVTTIYGMGVLANKNPEGSVVTLTFTPLGPLMDGTPAQTLTRSYTFTDKGLNDSFVIRNIPLGAYTATATLTAPGGTTVPMKFKKTPYGEETTTSQVIEFAPYSLEFLGKVERVNVTLTK
jgi:hypothetical protein